MDAMTPAAWVFMLSVWTLVTASVAYCFWKILTSPRRLDIDIEMQEVIEYQTLPKESSQSK